MSRIWFSQELETVATYWRLIRRDGVTLGFTTHDADLWFGQICHRTAPGMVPASIRRSSGFEPDSAEVQGTISHEAIDPQDLAAGRYDGATVMIGLVDWMTLEHDPIYSGTIGAVNEEGGTFTAELQSRKADLQRDPVPRSSPTCRASFCGTGCGLSAARFTHEAALVSQYPETNGVIMSGALPAADLVGGRLRWLDGPYAGLEMGIIGHDGSVLMLESPIDEVLPAGTRAQIREGCDHTLETRASRFANSVNFQGEPFLPGNDMIVRYGTGQ